MLRTVLPLFLVACAASDDPSDSEAELAPRQEAGKADAADFTGLYRSTASTHYANDIPSLELRSDGRYVRSRCYHASCALQLPETDAFDQYTASSGKTYVRFWSEDNGQPMIAEVYEIHATSTGIKLRKAHVTRWSLLAATTETAQCTASGGAWNNVSCTCPGNVPGTAQTVFVPGAGGCIAMPGADESNCDNSGGSWTDDDATLIGSYCVCGYGRYDDATGSCATI